MVFRRVCEKGKVGTVRSTGQGSEAPLPILRRHDRGVSRRIVRKILTDAWKAFGGDAMKVTRVGMYSRALKGWIVKDETKRIYVIKEGVK